MSIASQVLESVLSAAAEHDATAIEQVELTVGAMQLVVHEALELAWSAAVEGTAAAGAELRIVEAPIKARCCDCGRHFEPRIDNYACPDCRRADVEIIEGNDIVLTSVVCRTAGEEDGHREQSP